MNTDATPQKDPLTDAILGAAFEVANALGHGFLEIVYQRALACELDIRGIPVEREVPYRVLYKGKEMGTYLADLVIGQKVIVELKSIPGELGAPHVSQCLNYLRASGLRTGLIINFGRPKLEYRRVVR
jgi:GxxExxY protein